MQSWFSVVAAAPRSIRLRLVRALVLAVVCVSGLIGASEALADAPVTWYWWRDIDGSKSYNATSDYRATKQDACDYAVPRSFVDRGLSPGWTFVSSSPGTNGCSYVYRVTSNGTTGSISNSGALNAVTWCANNTAPNTSKPLAEQCGAPPPTCPAAGQVSQANYYTVTSDSKLGYSLDLCVPLTGTSGGCGFKASGRVGGQNVTTGKWEYQYMGPLTTTGQTCTGNGGGITDPEKDKPRKCDAGMCTGTVNGVEICGRCAQTETATNATKTTTNPDGSTTQVTTNTSTTINNNNVTTTTTTTTTTTPAGGGTPTTGTKTETTSETKDSYCQRNPNDAGCKSLDGQASGGDTCVAPPVCNGDAVQCMMVQQQWLSRCQYEKQTAQSDLATQILAGNDPGASSNPAAVGNREVKSLADAVEQTPFLNGGGGLQDKVFTVNGRGITFPFSKLNPYLVMIGNVFVAISLIGAARIVLGVK